MIDDRQLAARIKHFSRREKAAVAGVHLPSEEDLLLGMTFFASDITRDIEEFCSRQLMALASAAPRKISPSAEQALNTLRQLPDDDGLNGFVSDILELPESDFRNRMRLRARIYRAARGNADESFRLAAEFAGAILRTRSKPAKIQIVMRMLELVSIGATQPSADLLHPEDGPWRTPNTSQALRFWAARLEELFETPDEPVRDDTEDNDAEQPPGFHQVTDERTVSVDGGPEMVVVSKVGLDQTRDGKNVKQEAEGFLAKPLPLPVVKSFEGVRRAMLQEFPHAEGVLESILGGLEFKETARIPPTILVGPPGCGKSRFARRLCEELGLKRMTISCGGVADAAIAGAARRWSTGHLSVPMQAVSDYLTAGPVIVLDEIDKVATSKHNGNVHDAIGTFLEQETASRFVDPYLMSECDLSQVSWLMTANTISDFPGFLKDRCRILKFPTPAQEHIERLAQSVLGAVIREDGLPSDWATPLDNQELSILRQSWTDGSLRSLRRLIIGVQKCRLSPMGIAVN